MPIIFLKKVLKVVKAFQKLNNAERREFCDMIGVRVRFEELIQEGEKEEPNRTALREMDNPFTQEDK